MAATIVDTILTPKYQKEYNFKNLDEKVEICKEIKRLEKEIMSQLDAEHKKLFRGYVAGWDKIHTELSLDTFASGLRFAEKHNS